MIRNYQKYTSKYLLKIRENVLIFNLKHLLYNHYLTSTFKEVIF
ncbi:hypothetical protein NIES4103_31670 [Nostoc sp. NIES-4103]|nr:hypothetical protein NIES4103_31670 [Nostoc sp. NIES-4103]